MAEDKAKDVLMERDGVKTEVAAGESVKIMEALGWKLAKAAKGDGKAAPADGKAADA
ncbi:MAG: hypothetical protein ACYC0T_21300 [Ramlibacter sp.]